MNEITTQELKQLIESKQPYTLLDCRSQDYYNWEQLPHATNLRWKYLKEEAHSVLPDKHALIVLYCDGFTCHVSTRAYQIMSELGYSNLREYSGGVADWKAHNYPTIQYRQYKPAANIFRFPDQSFAHQPVNTYLIEEDDCIVLVDGPQQLTEEHDDFMRHFAKPIKIFMTHNPTAGDTGVLQKKYKATIYLHHADRNGPWLTIKPDVLIDNGYQFNDHLTVIHTPGHSPGSACLLDTKNKVLFSGDTIEGVSDTTAKNTIRVRDFINDDDEHEGDSLQRLTSLHNLIAYDFEQILPFHYSPITRNAKQLLVTYIKNHEK